MQKEYKNKMINGQDVKTKDSSQVLQEYHFSGSGIYHPLTVKARSSQEAEKLWRQKRQKVESTQTSNNNQVENI